ncbi:dTMP kinase [Mahella australiensis]|uniref:Thymidylate kinase n=1 Tax=Mahella australiensis (strain DSM 15567 / CIP 107919 / 50-1 BON) TaxID=697281 RepID=F3ZXS4_MAHA5|nr:dTMP kinase [Mahella australiensis]AEE95581.1 thymidylate kinase [Mahella australiensis 50-1 BON]
MSRGLFITIEGIDGSGKSTHASMLADYLNERGIPSVLTREPGGTRIGEQVRSILLDNVNSDMAAMTEVLLYAASRAQHVAQVIKPALEQGKVVLCDRFVDSSLAYQGYARGLGLDTVKTINEHALGGVWPDITLLLDISPEIAWKRILKDGFKDRLESEGLELLKVVYEGYRNIARLYSDRFYIISAADGVNDIHKKILSIIEPKLKKYRLI